MIWRKEIQFKKKRIIIFLIFTLIVASFLLIPLFEKGYFLRFLTFMFTFAIISQGLNITAGYSGYIPFGHMAFFGAGAYIVAVSMINHVSFLIALLFNIVISIIIALIAGYPLLRLRGAYFTMGTIAFNGVIREVTVNLTKWTGGGYGISLPQIPWNIESVNTFFYYIMFGWLAVCTIVIYLLAKNPVGYALRAIKDDENAAATSGINTTKYKMIAWVTSAVFVSIGGGIYAYWMTFIDASVYDISPLIKSWVILLVGGAGTVMGPLLGAFLIESLSELLWGNIVIFHNGFLGIIIIIFILVLPGGIIDLFKKQFKLSLIREEIRKNKI